MQPIPMVRANVIVPFVQFLETVGAPADRVFAAVRLSPRLVSEPETLLPLHKTLAFMEFAARSEGHETLGLELGLGAPFETLGRYARVACGAPTLLGALSRLIDAIALHNSDDRVWLTLHGGFASLCHTFGSSDSSGLRQGEQFSFAMMMAAVRGVLGVPDWRPDRIRLPAWEAGSRQAIEARLQAPVTCTGMITMIVFPTDLLAAPSCAAVRGLGPLGDDDRLLRSTAPAADFAGSIRQTIGVLLLGGPPSIRDTAEAVGVSARTLQRRLAACGETYSGLVDTVRLETGARLLCDTDAKLLEIAYELGYTDPANFTRAFKRWAGVAPRAYRRAQSASIAGCSDREHAPLISP